MDGPTRVAKGVRRYAVGRQRYTDLTAKHRLRVTTRLGLLAHAATRPGTSGLAGWAGRVGLAVVKPLVLLAALVLGAPTRAAVLGFTGLGLFGLTAITRTGSSHGSDAGGAAGLSPFDAVSGQGTGLTTAFFGTGEVAYGVGALVLMVVTVLAAGGVAVLLGSALARGWSRWVCSAAIGIALMAAYLWLVVSGFVLAPLGLAVVAAVLTWFGAVACRIAARFGMSVLSGLVFLLVPLAWQLVVPTGTTGGWVLCAVVVTAYAHAVLVSLVDVLPPRRRGRTA